MRLASESAEIKTAIYVQVSSLQQLRLENKHLHSHCPTYPLQMKTSNYQVEFLEPFIYSLLKRRLRRLMPFNFPLKPRHFFRDVFFIYVWHRSGFKTFTQDLYAGIALSLIISYVINLLIVKESL